MATGFSGAGKGDLVDVRMGGDPLTQVITAAHGTEHPSWQYLLRQLDYFQIAQRGIGRGFDDHGATSHQGRRNFPDGQQNREVPGDDCTHNAHGCIAGYHAPLVRIIDSFLRQVQRGCGAQPISRAKYFPLSTGPGFPLLAGQQRHDLLSIVLDQVCISLQRRLALLHWRFAPTLESLARGGHSLIQLRFGCIG